MPSASIKNILCLSLIVMAFAYTVYLRHGYIGYLSTSAFENPIAKTLKFTRNYCADNPFKINFLMLENPDSIEFQDIASRTPYLSFLSGVVIRNYLVALLNDCQVSERLLHYNNLFNQLSISILIYLISLHVLSKNRDKYALSLLAALFYQLNSGSFYWHIALYFTTQEVIIPYLVVVFLITLRLKGKISDGFFALSYFFASFYLCLVDWFAYPVFLTILAVELLRTKSIRQAFSSPLVKIFCYSIVISLSLFILQILSFQNGFEMVYEKFMFRTGMVNISKDETSRVVVLKRLFWLNGYFEQVNLRFFNVLLLLGMTGFLALRRDSTKLVILALLFLPFMFFCLLLPGHVRYHLMDLQLILPFICLAPLWQLKELATKSVYVRKTLLISILLLGFPFFESFKRKDILLKQTKSRPDYELANYIRNSASFEDVYFSPNISTPPIIPTNLLALTMKRIFPISKWQEFADYSWNDHRQWDGYHIPDMEYKRHKLSYRIPKGAVYNLIIIKGKCSNYQALQKRFEGQMEFDGEHFFIVRLDGGNLSKYGEGSICQS